MEWIVLNWTGLGKKEVNRLVAITYYGTSLGLDLDSRFRCLSSMI